MVRSGATVGDLEGNVNGAGVQEKLGGQNWCRDVARRAGQDSAFEADGYRIWKRQRPEEKGMVLKGHVKSWIQKEGEPKKQACVWGLKGCSLKGEENALSCPTKSPWRLRDNHSLFISLKYEELCHFPALAKHTILSILNKLWDVFFPPRIILQVMFYHIDFRLFPQFI